jgi:hypothetical protein
VTAVAERTEEEQLLESWLDGEVPCHMVQCSTPATWRLALNCRHSVTYCAEHKRQMSRPGVSGIVCDCGHKTPIDQARWSRL